MGRYEGDPALPKRVFARDKERCRWCGVTNGLYHIHHITYRRGAVDDTEENLITLCAQDHSYVHGLKMGSRPPISKERAQAILRYLVLHPGVTGLAVMRRMSTRGTDASLLT